MYATKATMGLSVLAGWLGLVLGGCGKSPVDQQARAELTEKLGHTTITVFPALVRNGQQWDHDQTAAATLADWFNQQGLARAVAVEESIPITGGWGRNEAAMYRASAADVAAYLAEHPVGTEYALVCEYLLGGSGKVVGVHVYLLRADGRLAYGALLNSHHAVFQAVAPRSVADCTRVVLRKLEADLVPAAKGSGR